jgi:DNA-binding GntR family transcriptional regulator
VNETEPRWPAADALYTALRERILSGTLPPGIELRQETLARQFGVSRVPMREALSRLRAEGMIILRPQRGFAVTSLDEAEIIEIFELRMVLEQHALEIAARLHSDADVRAAERFLHAMEKLDLRDLSQVPIWLDFNHAFHTALVAASNRHRLTNITCTLRDSVEPYIRMEFHLTRSLDKAIEEHRPLFEAFAGRDEKQAGVISRAHCKNALDRLLESIRRRSAPPPPCLRPRQKTLEKPEVHKASCQAAAISAASITNPRCSEIIFNAASSIAASVPRTRSRATITR